MTRLSQQSGHAAFKAMRWAAIALLFGGAVASASAQTVGKVSSTPLQLTPSHDSYSYGRISGPAPATRLIDGVAQASYNQAPARSMGPAPTTQIASARTTTYGASQAIPLGSLPPASSVPTYYPTSYTTTYPTQTYPVQTGAYYPTTYAPVSPYIQRTSYPQGAANQPPTLVPTTYLNCGSPPTYPISSAAPVPYAAPQQAPGARPFIPLTQMPNQVYVSRGLLGQPVVYVPGQPVRNALRYLTP